MRSRTRHRDIEQRLAALEDGHCILNGIAADQLLRLRDLEHNVTILLGVQSSQGQDIKTLLDHAEAVNTCRDGIERQLATIIGLLTPDKP